MFGGAPGNRVAVLVRAAIKAFLANLYLPMFLVVGIAYVCVFSARIRPDLAVVLLSAILHSLITYRIMKDEDFPFTRSFEFAQDPGSARMILLTFILGAFLGVHFIARSIDYGIYVYLVLLIVAFVGGWRKTFPEGWKPDDAKGSSEAEVEI